MMMALGQFAFGLSTVAYQELKRQTAWRHPSNSRVGAPPARQSIGPGDDTITLTGLLMPELMGSPTAMSELREMGQSGEAWPLVDGAGFVYGVFAIESLHETGTLHIEEGLPRRTEFQLQLVNVGIRHVDDIGGKTPSQPSTQDTESISIWNDL